MKMEKWKMTLWETFVCLFLLFLTAVVIVSVIKPENNLPAVRMMWMPLVWVVAFAIMYVLLKKLDRILERMGYWIVLVLCICYGIGVFVMAINSLNEPVHDQYHVLEGGKFFAGLTESISWEYFARCNNNIFPAAFLGILLRLGALFVPGNALVVVVAWNVLQIVVVMLCSFWFMKRLVGNAAAYSVVFMQMMFLPHFGHAISAYTDMMTYGVGIVVLALFCKAKELCGTKKWVCLFFAGVLGGIGASIKMTVLIPLVAIVAWTVLREKRKNILWGFAPLLLATGICLVVNGWTATLPSENLRDAYGTPKLSYWFAIGLQGNGGYVDNQEYSIEMSTVYGMDNKTAYTNAYIKDNLGKVVDLQHLTSKARYNFANGNMGTSIYVQNLEESHLLRRLMHYDGDLYWYQNLYASGYQYALYLLIIVVLAFALFGKHKENVASIEVSLVAIFGIMLYLMLFEANNRQLYNHIPFFILVAVYGVDRIVNLFLYIRKK